MVKLNYKNRINTLKNMITIAKSVNKSVPRMEKQLKGLEIKYRKNNKSILEFK